MKKLILILLLFFISSCDKDKDITIEEFVDIIVPVAKIESEYTLEYDNLSEQHVYYNQYKKFTHVQIYFEQSSIDVREGNELQFNEQPNFSTNLFCKDNKSIFNKYPIFSTTPKNGMYYSSLPKFNYDSNVLALWTEASVNTIPRMSLIRSDTIKVFINVKKYKLGYVKDSILIILHPM